MESDDQAKLLWTILRYVNDKKIESVSKIVELVFEPIKQQLKVIWPKWEVIRRSLVGAAGLKKWWNKKTKKNEANGSFVENRWRTINASICFRRKKTGEAKRSFNS
jgi:hypothetical protein